MHLHYPTHTLSHTNCLSQSNTINNEVYDVNNRDLFLGKKNTKHTHPQKNQTKQYETAVNHTAVRGT